MAAWRDHYGVLGIEPSASAREITSAYRTLVRSLHPDSRPSQPEAPERFAEVVDAYETLHDPAQRSAYDAERDRRNRKPSAPRGRPVRVRVMDTPQAPAGGPVTEPPLRRSRPGGAATAVHSDQASTRRCPMGPAMDLRRRMAVNPAAPIKAGSPVPVWESASPTPARAWWHVTWSEEET
ncbi:J domain-containing protein [Streptomyces gobiensis]|uniref:J domain-containing protein n=1 Tax=Streptomyces gobiensis TaxID=2875706 RepID=UPI001E305ED5|nr:J domain-containing protein [Streptomyces gobiensis]UGY90524.1 J domain-containing protein [Streptomyces gobiensis]